MLNNHRHQPSLDSHRPYAFELGIMASPSGCSIAKRDRARHATLYFADGDVILAASSQCSNGRPAAANTTTSEQLFRVHRFMLVNHSSVFADIFSLPIPTDSAAADELYDGVPVVQMSDRPDDLASLIGVLYDPTALLLKRRDPHTPYLIEGILRIATKYQFERLRSRLLEHFASDWPQTVDDWDLFQAERDVVCAQHVRAADGQIDGLYADDRFPDPAPAIRLAHEFECPEILPAAYYCAVQISSRNSRHRMRTTDAGLRMLERGHFSVRWNLLHKRDMDRLSLGRETLLKIANGLPSLFGSSPVNSIGCLSPAECDEVRAWQRNFLLSLPAVWDPLAALHRLAGSTPPFESGMCKQCRTRLDNLIYKKRVEIWRALPMIFGLES